jgi:hypothetical protein
VTTLANDDDRGRILRRVAALRPDSGAVWGRMDAGRMLGHLSSCLSMALGDLPVKPGPRTPFRYFPLKHLVLYVLPLPKNVRTAPELVVHGASEDFEAERARVRELVGRFATTPQAGRGAEHPLFGVLTWPEWGVLQYRHADHHLRQFGV